MSSVIASSATNRLIIYCALASLLLSLIEVAFAHFLPGILSVIVEHNSAVAKSIYIFIGIGILRALVSGMQFHFYTTATESFKSDVRLKLIDSFNFSRLSNADFLSIYTHKTDQVGNAIHSLASLIANAVISFFLICYLLFTNTRITLIGLLVLIPAMFAYKLSENYSETILNKIKSLWAESFKVVNKVVYDHFLVKVSGKLETEKSTAKQLLVKRIRFVYIQNLTIAVRYALPQIAGMLFLLVVILSSSTIHGEAITFTYLFLRLSQFGAFSAQHFAAFQTTSPYLKEIFEEVRSLKTDLPRPQMTKYDFDSFTGWNISSLSFKYSEDGPYVLKDKSFTINRGDFFLIYGPSGKGKSTLLLLIAGFLKPSSGTVTLNNKSGSVNSHEVHESILDSISYVGARNYISEGSLRENVLYGINHKVSDEDIIGALNKVKLSNLHERGLDTPIQIREEMISSGQVQRIALARAILKDSPIWIFDEITSFLDDETETEILNLISKMKNVKTIIAVSHKARWKDFADKSLNI